MEWSNFHRKTNKHLNDKHQKHISSNDDLDKIWESVASYKSDYKPDMEAGLRRFKDRIKNESQIDPPKVIALKPRRNVKSTWYAIAASLSALVVVTFIWYQNSSANPLIASYTTTAGEQKEVSLPDGSKVWMNESSKLTFDWENNQVKRAVVYEGEGFFDITKDPNKPFIIEGPKSTVTVLGTSFNYRDYPDEGIADVEVLTGKVKFKVGQLEKEVEPQERGFINDTDQVDVKSAKNLNADSWRDLSLQFLNTPLGEILEDLGRHYHVVFSQENLGIKDCTYTSNFTDESLEDVLRVIERISGGEVKEKADGSYQLIGGVCASSKEEI